MGIGIRRRPIINPCLPFVPMQATHDSNNNANNEGQQLASMSVLGSGGGPTLPIPCVLGDRRGAYRQLENPWWIFADATDDNAAAAAPSSASSSVELESLLSASGETSSSLERRGAKGGPPAVVSRSSSNQGGSVARTTHPCSSVALSRHCCRCHYPCSQQEHHHPSRRHLIRQRFRLRISAWRTGQVALTGRACLQGESHEPVEVVFPVADPARAHAPMRWSAAPFSSSSSSFALLFSPWETGRWEVPEQRKVTNPSASWFPFFVSSSRKMTSTLRG
jgi:hypothetical protein